MPDILPPQNLEAEQATLGSMMLSAEALHKGLTIVRSADFYRPTHQEICDSLEAMGGRNEPIDLITLQEELRKRGKLEDCGGTEYLMALVESVPTASNVEHYARVVLDKSKRRQIIAGCTEAMAAAHDEELANPENVMMQQAVAVGSRDTGRLRSSAELIDAAFTRIEAYSRGQRRMGIPFGLTGLDRMIYGCGEGELILIGGRPSQGKSILLAHALLSAAKMGKKPLLFSKEMTGEDLTERLIHMEARVDLNHSHAGKLDKEEDGEWQRLTASAGDLYSHSFYIDDLPCPLTQLCAKARSAKISNDIGIVLVDYLQLIECDIKTGNRDGEIEKVTKTLKMLAKELNIPVVVPSQLSRGIERRDDKTPILSDLRDGGNQEGHADKVILLDNPLPKDQEESGKLEARRARIHVAKHRGGRVGVVPVWFTPYWTRFDDITTEVYD